MNLYIDDHNEIDLRENQEDEIRLQAGDTINLGSSDYNDLTNKPSIDGTELVGDVSLEDIGAAHAEDIPTKVSDLENDSGYITEDDIPPIPTKTSDLLNDNGFITEDDIPPLVTDLGEIDPEEYDYDVNTFINTLIDSGWYFFFFDEFTYFAQVQSFGDNNSVYVNQHVWSNEENPSMEYVRGLYIEDGEVVDELSNSYITYEDASSAFATKTHAHFDTKNAAMSVFDWCGSSGLTFDNAKPFILYTDTLNNKNWIIERYSTVRQPNYRFIKVYDMSDSSHFYTRSGSIVGNTTVWGGWKEYPSGGGGMNITVDGTNYPITAITKTTVSGVSGVLVEYDDGNNGQLFFADGVGLATVKSAIEDNIPHDTSELTNGAGFLTISDLPIYDGGVS